MVSNCSQCGYLDFKKRGKEGSNDVGSRDVHGPAAGLIGSHRQKVSHHGRGLC